MLPVWVFPSCSNFPPTVQDIQVRLIGNYKLPVGVNGCVSLYVSPSVDWRLALANPRSGPCKDKRYRGQIDGFCKPDMPDGLFH